MTEFGGIPEGIKFQLLRKFIENPLSACSQCITHQNQCKKYGKSLDLCYKCSWKCSWWWFLTGLLFYLVHDFFLERGVTSVSAVHHATQCCWCNEELRECSQIQLQVNIPQQAIVSWTGKQITLRCCVTIAINWGVYADLILLHRGHTNSWCVLWWTGNSLITEYQFTVMTNIFYRK